MNRRHAVLSLVLLSACTTSEHLAIAEAQVPKLHRSMNEGAFEQIWYQATTQFQNTYPKEVFVALMLTVQRDLGEVRSAERQGWRAAYQGTGIEVTLSLSTRFAKGEARETVGYRVESGTAYLTTYLVESKQFAKRSDA